MKYIKSFFSFGLWLPVKFYKDPMPKVLCRMQVFFWIKRSWYIPISNEIKESLKIKVLPENEKPRKIKDGYLALHSAIMTETDGVVKTTQFKGSGSIYKRCPYMAMLRSK